MNTVKISKLKITSVLVCLLLNCSAMAGESADSQSVFNQADGASGTSNFPKEDLKQALKDKPVLTKSKLPPEPPPPPNYLKKKSREEMFQDTVDSEMPMSPDEIRRLRKIMNDSQRAKSETPEVPQKPLISTMVVTGDPGEVPAVIRLGSEMVSTLVFTDKTGAPWPIERAYSASTKFDLSPKEADFKDAKRKEPINVITLTSGSSYFTGNIQVNLSGRNAPIMITVMSDQKVVDYQANIVIKAIGPMAAPQVFSGRNEFKTDPTMLSLLDGVNLDNLPSLKTSNNIIKAYQSKVGTPNQQYFLRSAHTLLSPAWNNYESTADGLRVYAINPTSVVVFSVDGNPTSVNLGD